MNSTITIDIWQASLDISPQLEEKYWAILNTEEKQRANRFVKREDKTRFVAGRAILRYLLAQYLSLHPQAISFDYLSHGKPVLAKNDCSPPLQFNVSHSHYLALYAFTYSDYGIGIDVEFLRSLPDALSLAQRFFTESEAAYLASLPPQKQQAMFFKFWTAKEAYLKATGEGLMGLEKIEIAVSATNSNQFQVIKGEEQIQFHSFQPDEKFIATVAILENNSLNQGQPIDRALDTSNKWKAGNPDSSAESQENTLVFRNWDE